MSSTFVRIDRDEHGNPEVVSLLKAADFPTAEELSTLPLTTTLWETYPDGAAELVFDPARSKALRDANPAAFDEGDDNLLNFYNTTEYALLRVIEAEFIRRRVLNAHVGTVRPGVMGLVVQDGNGAAHGFYVVGHTGHTWHHRTPKGDVRVIVDSETQPCEDAEVRTLVAKFFQALGF